MAEPESSGPDRLQRTLVLVSLALLLYGLYVVLEPFVVAMGWAAILTLACWPLHRRLLRAMPRFPGLAAITMVLLLGVMIVLPAAGVGSALFNEAKSAVGEAQAWFKQEKPELPEWIRTNEQIGPWAQAKLEELKAGEIWPVVRDGVSRLLPGAVGVLLFVAQLIICLFAAYFLFRYGAKVVVQVQRVAIRIGGLRFERLLRAVKATVKGAVYGTVLTAVCQSVLAGVGFYFAKTPVPLLFGLATFVVAFVPFGPPLVYLPLAGVIVANGAPAWHGVLLALWGVGVVSTVDNILRPLFISQATQMPLLLVFFGVLGGVAAFGLIGVFLGPSIVAVAHVLWNEWAQPEIPPTTSEMRIVDVD